MNTLHLKYIVEVEKTGSITLAAKKLYMNQPNLSKAIKEFEASIGIDIFKRTPKGIVPTPKGEEFLSYAKSILAKIEEMEALYKSDKNKISFSLSAPRASYISYAFTQFVEKLDETKELEMNYIETNSMKTINNVAEGECRLGIIRYHLDYENYFINLLKEKELQYEVVWEFENLVLISRNNPIALIDNLSYKDLNKGIEIVHGDLSVPHLSAVDIKKSESNQSKKRRIYIYERGSQFDLLNQVTSSYMWVSPLPEQQLNKYGLIQKRCSLPNQRYRDVIIYPEGQKILEIDNAFITELKHVRDSISATL